MTIYKQTDAETIQSFTTNVNGSVSNKPLILVDGQWQQLNGVVVDLTNETIEPIPQSQIDADALQAFKSNRQALIDNAVVTTELGNQYDADEVSINRMTMAIIAVSDQLDTYELSWSLYGTGTGVMTAVTVADIKQAQGLAVQNMANIWSNT